MDYREAVRQLFGLQRFGIRLELDRVRDLLESLGDPQDSFEACHIAGTNGKGTCAAALDALLNAHGVRCALYISPHLLDPRERVKVAGHMVPEEYVAGWAGRHLEDARAQEVTFFEAMTALAFDYFRQAGAEAGAIEVGLGGRYDATNVLRPALTVITSIGIEHVQYLGPSLSRIAGEKAGIVKPGVPLLCAEKGSAALEVIGGICRENGSPLLRLDEEASLSGLRIRPDGTHFDYSTPGFTLRGARVSFYGRHQVCNVALALRAAELMLGGRGLALREETARHALEDLYWPGRFQRVSPAPGLELVLDVAHNPPAARRLVSVFRQVYGGRKALVVAALAADKDFARFLRPLYNIADTFLLPAVGFGGSDNLSGPADPETLHREVLEHGRGAEARVMPGMAEALAEASRIAGERVILVTGSFRTVGEAMRVLNIPS
jgi:dihydrofolate synthase / folylpolyglutamate synthase